MPFAGLSAREASDEASRLKKARPHAFELVACLVMLLSLVASTFINHRLIRPLAALYAEIGLALPLPLRAYLTVTHLTALWVMVCVLLVALAIARVRAVRAALSCVAGVAALNTMLGLWSVADAGVRHAMLLDTWKIHIMVERDLAALHLAADQPQAVIALIDPKRKGDYPTIRAAGAAGNAFQLAEAYRLAGDLDAARRLYHRALEAANALDENGKNPGVMGRDFVDVLFDLLRAYSIMPREEQWQASGVRDLHRLPDVVRAVSGQRLDQLHGVTSKAGSRPSPH